MGISDNIRKKILNEIDNIKAHAVEIAEYIFDNPEISENEFNTQKYLTDELIRNGFKVEIGSGSLQTAFRAEYKFKRPGPSVGFIAEYDALLNMGHACHHHLIAASSVNIAIAMSRLGEDLCGKVIVIGTPAEEKTDAKGMMWKNGAFKNIDAGLMFHGGPENNTKLIVLAMNGLEFSFKGKASHAAAAPYEGVNALDAVILLFTSINALRQQLKDDVRIHGIISNGGDSINIIPEKATAKFYIRAQHREYLNEVTAKIKNCAKGAAIQTGTELIIAIFEDPGSNLLKNINLVTEFEKNFKELGGVLNNEPFLLGSSDIGNLSYMIPVLHPMIKTAKKGCALHTKEFLNYGKSDIAYNGMIMGMKSLALTASRIMLDKEYLNSIKKEFMESMKDKEKNI